MLRNSLRSNEINTQVDTQSPSWLDSEPMGRKCPDRPCLEVEPTAPV